MAFIVLLYVLQVSEGKLREVRQLYQQLEDTHAQVAMQQRLQVSGNTLFLTLCSRVFLFLFLFLFLVNIVTVSIHGAGKASRAQRKERTAIVEPGGCCSVLRFPSSCLTRTDRDAWTSGKKKLSKPVSVVFFAVSF